MKFHPILFSTEMVQAILAGRKTMTRRVMKLQPTHFVDDSMFWINPVPCIIAKHGLKQSIKSPYGHTGDVLWVREKHCWMDAAENNYAYAADYGPEPVGWNWKPSIHMPKTACRIFLKIKSLRVERLHDISEEDAKAEGVRYPVNEGRILFKLGEDNSALKFMPDTFKLDGTGTHPTENDLMFAHWAELWCSINGRESWEATPWVWVISFERIEKPENFC